MACDTLSIILMGVVCGCCVLLYVVVIYLCVVVRGIRRKLNDLSRARDGSIVMENVNKRNTGEDTRNRTSSGNERYTVKPLTLPHRPNSHRYSNSEETVTVLEINREVQQEISNIANKRVLESSTSKQHIVERPREAEPQTMHIEFVNMAFNPDTRRDSNNPEWVRCNTMDISQIP